MEYNVIYIMGVAGSGKTTIGQQLSEKTGYPFYDADDFHSAENKTKMNAGIPLTDEDRWPWLESIHDFVSEKIKTQSIILVCSALKEVYRERLSASLESRYKWIYLKGNYNTIFERLQKRKDHYMPPTLLQSQFDALEPPHGAIIIDIDQSPNLIVNSIINLLNQ